MMRILLAAGIIWSACAASLGAPPADHAPTGPIRRIYLVHFSHTDFGYTDLQSVTRELQMRYLDMAIDAVNTSAAGPEDRKFRWTAESTVPVADWWAAAPPSRREDFRRALKSRQLEVAAMPLNQTPFLNARQWQTMLQWLPEDLWRECSPSVAIQNDVNGLPRAGAIALLDRGIRHLFMGINADSGGPPFYRPSAFWWKMPDGRRLFVWLNHSYPDGIDFFESQGWRRGPVPRAGDTQLRPPRGSDVFKTDEASLRAAHAQCLRRIEQIRQEGYPHDVLTISVTNQWRMDNDPPFPALADFVAAWNKLGLQPELRLVTVSEAVQAMEKSIGDRAPEHAGEFPDWWANGAGSTPREVAASRLAKRLLASAESPLWGPLSATARAKVESLYRDLCLFDEHTWGAAMSVATPWTLDSQAQFMEKALFAYRPMAHAEWLLSQRARTRLLGEGEGLFVANTTGMPFSGWVRLNADALRGNFKSVEVAGSGERLPLSFEPGLSPWRRPLTPEDLTRENLSATHADTIPNRIGRFWLDDLRGGSVVKLRFSEAGADAKAPPAAKPEVALDALGWPQSARWSGMAKPLFVPGLGGFLSVGVKAFAPRWALLDIAYAGTAQQRQQLRRERLEEVRAEPEGQAVVEETPHTLIYSQWLRHPRLQWAMRRVELWRNEPRARVTLRFYRISDDNPEALFAEFPLPCEGVLPTLSSGGQPFTPYTDQLPGSCRDYFGIDGWAHYATPDGHWMWVSRDAPLMTLGGPHVWARRTDAPQDTHRVLAMLFNNHWHTNFASNEHGTMEFQFDLVWREKIAGAAEAQAVADALTSDPVVLINGAGTDDSFILQRVFKP